MSAGIASLVAAALIAPAASASDDTTFPSVPRRPSVATAPTDQFIVKFKDPARSGSALRAQSFSRAAGKLGATAKDVRGTAGGARVVRTSKELGDGDAEKLLASLRADPAVAYAEPDVKLHALASNPNDPAFVDQWNLSQNIGGIRVTGAWDVTKGAGQVVAVLDTGITSHTDLDANVLPGYDMISSPEDARDGDARDADATDMGDWSDNGQCSEGSAEMISSWHGTHVAGIIAAVTGNASGIAGVAPQAKILPLRVLGPCGGQVSDIADAILWASGAPVTDAPANLHPARVINLSLGGTEACPQTFQDAIDIATARGAVVVAAAGNEMAEASTSTPANCRNVISVAASGHGGGLAPYSNFGAGVDITAPGGDMTPTSAEDPDSGLPNGVLSTGNDGDKQAEALPGTNYYWVEGTSFAAPHVAGVAALLAAQMGPTATPAAVEARLKATARPITGGCPQGCGAGLVDAAAALLPNRVRITLLVATGDLNGDRKADAVARDSSGTLWLYPGNGRSGWLPRVRMGGGWNVMTALTGAGDMNSDGKADVLARDTAGTLWLYPGNGRGGWLTRVRMGGGWNVMTAVVGSGDMNSDRKADLLARDSSGTLWLYPGKGHGGWLTRVRVGGGWNVMTALVGPGDMSGDGKSDLVARDSSGNLWLYRGNGRSGWLPRIQMGAGWSTMSALAGRGDFSGDGRNDLLAIDADGVLWLYGADASGGRVRMGGGWG
ncbi:S8 family serine peptidase [Arthrobacter sp. FW305-BF8]|uniref:S8 family serine peptidase n=1 Tax=Arthrobacter sp. FW305-BF8 TaxID=2879617 RepID=UPI001F017091|nr:S8 family serine peptidase [Arthrobacter sp. FW305-BF8]UKA53444.1 S8 family serine peptidase [Arthrobacter sp. FW305-BF8]